MQWYSSATKRASDEDADLRLRSHLRARYQSDLRSYSRQINYTIGSPPPLPHHQLYTINVSSPPIRLSAFFILFLIVPFWRLRKIERNFDEIRFELRFAKGHTSVELCESSALEHSSKYLYARPPEILVHAAVDEQPVPVEIRLVRVDPRAADLIRLLEQCETVSVQLGRHMTGHHQTGHPGAHNGNSRLTTRHGRSTALGLRKLHRLCDWRETRRPRREYFIV